MNCGPGAAPPESPAMNDPESLVLVPGLVCDDEVWAAQVAGFAGRWSVHVVAHAASSSLGQMAERIIAAAPARFALAGHSMGGRVALEIMARASERVTRLALLDTGFERLAAGEAGDRERAGRYRLRDIARTEGMLAMGRQWALGMVHPARLGDEALMDAIHQMIARATPQLFEAQIEALLARPDRRDLLPRIHVPTLVLCGNEDNWSPLARHVEMAAMIAGSTLVGVPDCGHMCTMERPAAITAALIAWMQR
jgi:pimeloyl-ACP methyl ester carboxylesterase